MLEQIQEMLSFSFINRAILVGSLVSICAALLGVSLVLKRYANIGDGLSHVGYGITTIAVTFDEEFSKAIGLKTERYTSLIAILTAVVIVVGMQMMGTLLISSIIIFPALTAMRIFKSFKSVVVGSGIISVACFLIGIFLSYIYNISTGATIVIVNLTLFLLFTILSKIIKE